MNILLIGSGGREHALAKALTGSPSKPKVYATPGNPGIFQEAEQSHLEAADATAVAMFCVKNAIDLVVVGPEQPLANGIADLLRNEGINVFGPSAAAAQLESSKGFAKDFMNKYAIPTAKYQRFDSSQSETAHKYLDSHEYPLVIKADGLAAGKGVIICQNVHEAHEALDSVFAGMFSNAGKQVVIEDFLVGEEVSILAITDGTDFITLAPSQDHKRVGDGDTGKNTGGMGAYAPSPIVNTLLEEKIKNRVLKPTIEGMKEEGMPFVGCLYAGLMIVNNEPYVIEFNVRFGDPETQVVLPIFEGDFAQILHSAAIGNLNPSHIKNIANGAACCVILASEGYPDKYKSGCEISGIDAAEQTGAIVFHAGTIIQNKKILSAGGRVLGVTALGADLQEAIDNAYSAVAKIHFDNMYFRNDIGQKGLKK